MADLNALAQMMSQNNQVVGNFGQQYVDAQKNALLREQIMQEMAMKQYQFDETKSRRKLRDKQAAADELKAEIELEMSKPMAQAALEQAQAQATESGVDAKYAEKYAQLKVRQINADIGRINAAAAASGRSNRDEHKPTTELGKILFDLKNASPEEKPLFLDVIENYRSMKNEKLSEQQIKSQVEKDEFLTDRFESLNNVVADPLKSYDKGKEPPEGLVFALEDWKSLVKQYEEKFNGDTEKAARAVANVYYVDEDDDYKLKKRSTNLEKYKEHLRRQMDLKGIGPE